MLTLRANAKINLVLSVGGRAGDGYHSIESVMQTVGIFDRLHIKKSGSISVRSDNAPQEESNICYKAAEIFKNFGCVDIFIEKNIPLSAGLGGGSADAAAVLLGANRLFGYPLCETELEKAALSLGADVPFFLRGGTCRARSRGEILSPVAPFEGSLLIIKYGEKNSTGEMYSRLDEIKRDDTASAVSKFIKTLETRDISLAAGMLFNDFQLVCDRESVKRDIMQSGALGACLSGSGPSVFGIFADGATADRAFRPLAKKYGNVFLCDAVSDAVVFE